MLRVEIWNGTEILSCRDYLDTVELQYFEPLKIRHARTFLVWSYSTLGKLGKPRGKTRKLSRSISQRTQNLLCLLNGNQCAHPTCSASLISPATDNSPMAFVGEMCHIYANSAKGPRGKIDLSDKEKNSPENLILLCRNHHVLVDRQYETFPAELLKQWKHAHEKEMQVCLSQDLDDVTPRNVISSLDFPRH